MRTLDEGSSARFDLATVVTAISTTCNFGRRFNDGRQRIIHGDFSFANQMCGGCHFTASNPRPEDVSSWRKNSRQSRDKSASKLRLLGTVAAHEATHCAAFP
jgi:hypothetical protein